MAQVKTPGLFKTGNISYFLSLYLKKSNPNFNFQSGCKENKLTTSAVGEVD